MSHLKTDITLILESYFLTSFLKKKKILLLNILS